MFRFLATIFACMVFVFPLDAQRNFDFSSDYKQWVVLGLGMANSHDYSFAASYNFGRTRFYQLGLYSNFDFTLGGNQSYATALAASYGKRYHGDYHTLAAFVGPAYVFSRKLGDGLAKAATNKTVGLNFDVHLLLRPVPEIGFGLDLSANLNPTKNIIGAKILLCFGNGK